MDQVEALIAMGGNIGGAAAVMGRFGTAAAAIRQCLGGRALRSSRVYLTPPVGPVAGQPHFLNAAIACAVPATMAPTAILGALLDIEAAHGRVRTPASLQGPRTLDLDLLFFGEQTLRTAGPPALVLPHPRVAERAFVLQPLADLQGLGWRMPGIDRRVGACLADPAVARQRAEMALYADAIASAPRET
ncbi:MAG TPA: 2-amino-4-hydroxy-6-hydroxymethyldihydropteridine diphosphokinase [Haliangium sp.]|nr:2-amino-4-hydroxy-6-hydroxymethyldihydropteridine diphosphokinase [Haliangium sp.]